MKPQNQNFFDRFVASISPERGLKRLIAREKLSLWRYDAAVSSRRRANVAPLDTPESSTQQMDRVQLMRGGRDLVQNVGFVKSLVLKFATYVAGSITYQSRTGDAEVDAAYEDYFRIWSGICDITGRHNFTSLMQMNVVSAVTDGDCGLIFRKSDNGLLQLQGIEADRIGGPYNTTATPNYFGGITVDEATGKPISYRVYSRTPNGQYTDFVDVPAIDFILFCDPFRMDQYRGVSAFHAAINTLQDVREILEFEKMAVKWGASQSGVIETPLGEDKSGVDFDETTTDANDNAMRLMAIEGGKVSVLEPGQKLNQFVNSRPSNTFQGFIEALYRDVALSLNLPYGFVYDLSKLSGPAARMESAQAQRTFFRWQELLKYKALEPIKNRVIMEGIAARKIPMHPRYMSADWLFPAHPTIDVGRESVANLNENRQALRSAADICGEANLDWEKVHEQCAKEAANINRLAKKYGVTPNEIRILHPTELMAEAMTATAGGISPAKKTSE